MSNHQMSTVDGADHGRVAHPPSVDGTAVTVDGTDPLAPAPTDRDLAHTLAVVSQAMIAQEDLEGTIRAVCRLASGTIPGCDHAAVSLATRGRVTTRGASDRVPELVDAIQYELGEGPCVDAVGGVDVVEVADLAGEVRWPAFTRRILEESAVRSMLAFRLVDEGRTLGALNLYSETSGALGPGSAAVEIGVLYAAHATVALVAARRSHNLQEALATRSAISVAVGLLMARQHVSEEEAFEMLRRASQRTNVKLRDLAKQLAARAVNESSGPAEG